jgi:putative redox protein
MDGPEDFGGSNAGTRPKELILLALGGCTGSDVAVILKKKKVKYDSFEMNISAEMQGNSSADLYKIHVEYVFSGKQFPPKPLKEQ